MPSSLKNLISALFFGIPLARKYNLAFKNHPNIETPKAGNGCKTICDNCDCHVFHQYTLKIKNADRDGLVAHLNAKGIPCGVYYPIPLHKQKAYQDERYNDARNSLGLQGLQSILYL